MCLRIHGRRGGSLTTFSKMHHVSACGKTGRAPSRNQVQGRWQGAISPDQTTAKMARAVEHRDFKSLRAQGQQNTPISEPQSHNSQYLARLSVDTEEGPLGSPHGFPGVASIQIRVSMRGHTLQPSNLCLGSLGSLSGFVIP